MSFSIKQGARGPTITITRGDTASFEITITDASGDEYTPVAGDVVTFTVKKSTKTEEALIQKTGTSIALEHDDTAELKYGTYVYDVQLEYASGDIDTFIGPADFVVTEEVTF